MPEERGAPRGHELTKPKGKRMGSQREAGVWLEPASTGVDPVRSVA